MDQFKYLRQMRKKLYKNKETFDDNKTLSFEKKVDFKQETIKTPKIENKVRGGLWKNK